MCTGVSSSQATKGGQCNLSLSASPAGGSKGPFGAPTGPLGPQEDPWAGLVLSQDDQDDSSWFWAYHPDVWSQIRMMLVLGVVGM